MLQSGISEQAFRTEVLECSAPVLVHFWAPWCGICRLIEPSLKQLSMEGEMQVKLVTVNADENLRLSSQYRITTLPTVLLFYGGQLVYRLDCYQKREELRAVLQEVMSVGASLESVPSLLQ